MNFLLITTLAYASSSSSSVGGSDFLMLLLPVGAFAGVYFGVYRYYRNAHKTFQFENETQVEVKNMRAKDYIVGSTNGTRSSTIEGKNSHAPRQRVTRILR